MKFKPLVSRRKIVATALLGAALGAHGQSWPERPIKLIAPSSPGGPPDVYARALAEHLGKALGQPVIVENVPAAGGMIAAQQVLRAPADGYTLLVNTAGMMTITPHANPRAKFRASDFAQVCQGVEAALVLVAHPQLGATTYAQLVQWVKSQKTPATYSSYSPGSPSHFLGYQWAEALGVEMSHIPYKSSPAQITDMLGATAPLGFAQIATAASHIKAGKLVAFATTGLQRAPQLPDVETTAELGLPQLAATVWFGLSAPKGVPTAIVERLMQEHERFATAPQNRDKMGNAGLQLTPGNCGDKFLKSIESDSVRWGRVVKATGFVAE